MSDPPTTYIYRFRFAVGHGVRDGSIERVHTVAEIGVCRQLAKFFGRLYQHRLWVNKLIEGEAFVVSTLSVDFLDLLLCKGEPATLFLAELDHIGGRYFGFRVAEGIPEALESLADMNVRRANVEVIVDDYVF